LRITSLLERLEQERLVTRTGDPPRWSLVHDYLVEPIKLATQDETTAREEANSALRYYTSEFRADRSTVIAGRKLRMIRQHADLATPEMRKLVKRSVRRGYIRKGSIAGIVTIFPVTTLYISTQQQWSLVSDQRVEISIWPGQGQRARADLVDLENGRRLVVFGDGYTAHAATVWNLETGRLLYRFSGRRHALDGVARALVLVNSPFSSINASPSIEEIESVDLATLTHQTVSIPMMLDNTVTPENFRVRAQIITSGVLNKKNQATLEYRLYDLTQRKEIVEYTATSHSNFFDVDRQHDLLLASNTLNSSPEPVSAGRASVRIWKISTGEKIDLFPGGIPRAFGLAPDHKRLAIVGQRVRADQPNPNAGEHLLDVIDLDTMRRVVSAKPTHFDYYMQIVVGPALIGLFSREMLEVYKSEDGSHVADVKVMSPPINELPERPSWVIGVDGDPSEIELIDFARSKIIKLSSSPADPNLAAQYNAERSRLLLRTQSDQVELWNTAIPVTLRVLHWARVESFGFTPDGLAIWLRGNDGHVGLYWSLDGSFMGDLGTTLDRIGVLHLDPNCERVTMWIDNGDIRVMERGWNVFGKFVRWPRSCTADSTIDTSRTATKNS
jgi:WD40 repeat protein